LTETAGLDIDGRSCLIIYYYATKAAQSNTEYKHTKTPKTH